MSDEPMSNDSAGGSISRRSLLRRGSCAALGLGGLMSQAHSLRLTNAALASTSTSGIHDHRALVCVFLLGGNDNGNTVIPLSGSHNGQDHAHYARARGGLALPQSLLKPTRITPANAGGRCFALHPQLAGLAGLFATGDVSIVANVGGLIQPTTKAQYQRRLVDLPPLLFAHSGQQALWQISTAQAPTGWRGRMADALQACEANPHAGVSMNLSIAGANVLQTGHPAQPHGAAVDELAGRSTALNPLPGRARGLTRQLDSVARMIEHGRSALGHTRQVFCVCIDGFDHHRGLIAGGSGNTSHGQRLAELDEGLTHFWSALGRLGLRDQVTTFTASEFGRTFKGNGSGSDHGWGGHHFVMGGRQLARGPARPSHDRGQMFGAFNDLTLDGPQDTGNGRYIPTTSVDEYTFEFARWMGVPASEMPVVLPNLGRFQGERAPLNMLG